MSAEDRLRAAALALPGAEERATWGKPTFRVAGRLFLTLTSDGSSATMKASLDDQAALLATDPAVFSIAAYLGRYGWVTVSIDRCDPDELAELVVEAWRQRAPRRLDERQQSQPHSGHRRGSPAAVEASRAESEPCR
ncbi:MAG: MmcQ/YjbR family DNA-binding protein [Acidimicrobiales bacterium]